jgi:hypothetical protein
MSTFNKYGFDWKAGTRLLYIEFYMIRHLYHSDKKEQLLSHYLNAHKMLLPEDSQHRWFILGMRRLVENSVNVFMGPASSNKTYIFAVHSLINFFTFGKNSLAIISSTDMKSLEIKVWGRVKSLFNRCRRAHDSLSGYILDSAKAITTEEIDEENEVAREMNSGIVCVACVSGGRFVGMGKFQGAKPPHSPGKYDGILTHYGDEAAVMQPSFLDAYSNWMVNNSGAIKAFKGVMGGNPTDISDPLCTAGEPVGGWDSFIDTEKTQEWTSRWYEAHVIAFDGRDSPNNDEPKNSFPFLISGDFVELMKRTHGDDSWQFYQQAIGKPSRGMVSNRVITINFCEQHKAFDFAVWKVPPPTLIASCDLAYGGGDRCVFMTGKIGVGLRGEELLEITGHEIVPIRLNQGIEPEEQIAKFIFDRSKQLGIPPENISYDSFGRGTMGFFLAALFGANCPVPVNSGDSATDRPVRFDYFVADKNARDGRRLKRCNEEYKKKVTELWFSVRECVHSEQLKGLTKDVAYEGQLRIFSTKGGMTELETKDEMKERVKKSPDLFDTLAILVETARRLGFQINRLGKEVKPSTKEENFFDDEAKAWDKAIKSGLLKH